MTNLLSNKTAAELKEMAKEAGIKNWWTMKKADLITALTPDEEPEPIVLTQLEKATLYAITQDEFFDAEYPDAIWTDVFLDYASPAESKRVRGVLSSLSKKGLIYMGDETLQLSETGLPIAMSLEKVELDEDTQTTEEYAKEIDGEPLMTLQELAFEYDFKETKARRILRNHNFERTSGRWEWHDETTVEAIKAAFDQYKK